MLERDNVEEDVPEVPVSYARERASDNVDCEAILNNYPMVFLRVPASRGSYQPSSNPPSPQAKGTVLAQGHMSSGKFEFLLFPAHF
jgi:hypothetical protein